jgi:hypothetical protein
MEAFAPLVARCRNHEHIILSTKPNCSGQVIFRLAAGCPLAPANIDDMSPFGDGLGDRTRQIQLRGGYRGASRRVGKNWND